MIFLNENDFIRHLGANVLSQITGEVYPTPIPESPPDEVPVTMLDTAEVQAIGVINDLLSGSYDLPAELASETRHVQLVMWLLAMQYAESTARISNLIFISPFVSLVLLYFLVGEQIYPATLVGLLMIILALMIQQYKGAKKPI